MNKTLIGLVSVSCSLVSGWALSAVDKPAQEATTVTLAQQAYPISFDIPAFHVTASFPIPSRQIDQPNGENKLYVAQGVSNPDSLSSPLTETFSLLYQTQAPLAQKKSLKATDLAQDFIAILKGHDGIEVNQLTVAHESAAKNLDEHFALLEVIERGRTDYYLMRFIVVGDGMIIGVHTLQKGDKAPDLAADAAWSFVDSIQLGQAGPKSS